MRLGGQRRAGRRGSRAETSDGGRRGRGGGGREVGGQRASVDEGGWRMEEGRRGWTRMDEDEGDGVEMEKDGDRQRQRERETRDKGQATETEKRVRERLRERRRSAEAAIGRNSIRRLVRPGGSFTLFLYSSTTLSSLLSLLSSGHVKQHLSLSLCFFSSLFNQTNIHHHYFHCCSIAALFLLFYSAQTSRDARSPTICLSGFTLTSTPPPPLYSTSPSTTYPSSSTISSGLIMRSLGAVLLAVLPLFLLPIATAFPSYASHQSHSNTPSTDNQRSSWRALSDSLIRKVWKLPENRSPLDVFAQATVERGGPAGKWVARYGEDVVLRFTLASPEEAAALADAANVLILDVWEFNNDWVDIRVAKDVVSVWK